MTRRVLIVRLDSMGDLLVCGPAVRAVAASGAQVTLLVSPQGLQAARLLPGVEHITVWDCPWISADPPPVERHDVLDLVDRLRLGGFDEAIVLTSFHQSALPTALIVRMAGVPRISACSTDYPGSLLDERIAEPADLPEPARMLRVVAAAGYWLPHDDDGRLRLRSLPGVELDDRSSGVLRRRYLVLHSGAAAESRTCSTPVWVSIAASLAAHGWDLVLTGTAAEANRTAAILEAAPGAHDLAGRLDLAQLAAVLKQAQAVVVGNTGPAHLAAAVATPVVSLFAPVVPAARWAPYTDQLCLLGDQSAPCRGSRARSCPVAGHPCLDSITGDEVHEALLRLGVRPAREPVAVGR